MKNFMLGLLLLTFSQVSMAGAKTTADFVLKDTVGNKHQLSQYKGKWVLVNYWATWCPPCLEEVPDLVSLYNKRRTADLMVLGVVFDYQDVKEVTEYVDDMYISYPIVLGDDAVVAQLGSAEVLPTTFIYNPQGVLVKIKRGLITKQYIEKMLGVVKN
ncbi:MAG: TlpA disulfide reductase family protein [Methylotenera sp.]